MIDDLFLLLIAIGSAAGGVVAVDSHLTVLAVLCLMIYTAALFWMGVRSGRE
jgi:hypothetical protein